MRFRLANTLERCGSCGTRSSFDPAGNLTDLTVTTDSGGLRHSMDLNQIMTRSGNWVYTCDVDGNLVDGDDRLVQVSKGEILEDEFAVDYNYDETGNLLGRASGVDVTTFVWDGLDLLSEALDSVVSTALLDGRVESFLRNGDFYLVQCDALGLTDANGEVLDRFEYGAWGELLPGSFDSVGLALRFVGGLGVRTDLQTGLMYMRHRWYCAASQRFISRDPIGLSGGANLYAYAENSPTRNIDPSGLKLVKIDEGYEEKSVEDPLTRTQMLIFRLHWILWYDDCTGKIASSVKVTNLTRLKQRVIFDFTVDQATRGTWTSTKLETIHPQRGRITLQARTNPLPADIPEQRSRPQPLDILPGETKSAGSNYFPIGNSDSFTGKINIKTPQYEEQITTPRGPGRRTVHSSNFGVQGTWIFDLKSQPMVDRY